MKILKFIKYFITDLIFPRRCLGCKKSDIWLCDACFSYIKPSSTQVCYICRRPSTSAKTCAKHFPDDHHRQLDRLFVAAHYSANPILKTAIYHFKYKNKPELAEILGKFLSEILLKNFFLQATSCKLQAVPIPLHPTRQKTRGYNQSELLTNKLISRFFEANEAIEANKKLLSRTKNTPSQAHTSSRQKRIENLKDAFHLNGPIDPQKIYILVDDVVTTGATLEECCKILKENGVKKVWGLVLARN